MTEAGSEQDPDDDHDDDDHDDDDHDDDEVVFELGEWTAEDRALLVTRLNEQHIAHEWEDGDLVVAEADADRADDVIDGVEYPDELAPADEAGDDNGAGYAVMSALFEASDRLLHAPTDPAVGGAFDEAADAVVAAGPPYGVAPEEWKQMQDLASNLCEQLDDADDDVIARDAAALRHLLSRYV
jgi:hypothetical protein